MNDDAHTRQSVRERVRIVSVLVHPPPRDDGDALFVRAGGGAALGVPSTLGELRPVGASRVSVHPPGWDDFSSGEDEDAEDAEEEEDEDEEDEEEAEIASPPA